METTYICTFLKKKQEGRSKANHPRSNRCRVGRGMGTYCVCNGQDPRPCTQTVMVRTLNFCKLRLQTVKSLCRIS